MSSAPHAGIEAAVKAILPGSGWQRCRVHFARNDLDTILSRVGNRHGKQADDWPLTEQTTTEYVERFEPPTPEEGPLDVIG